MVVLVLIWGVLEVGGGGGGSSFHLGGEFFLWFGLR